MIHHSSDSSIAIGPSGLAVLILSVLMMFLVFLLWVWGARAFSAVLLFFLVLCPRIILLLTLFPMFFGLVIMFSGLFIMLSGLVIMLFSLLVLLLSRIVFVLTPGRVRSLFFRVLV
jgi:hypothetical protein